MSLQPAPRRAASHEPLATPRPETPAGDRVQPRRHDRLDELRAQLDRIVRNLRIAVIYAGTKTAAGAVINPIGNVRAWKSYETVAHDIAQALVRLGCAHVSVLPEDMRLAERLRRNGIHMAWLNSGGVQGCDPVAHAPAMLEMLGIPYVGHSPLAAGMLDNKFVFKRQLAACGVPTAPFMEWRFGRGRFTPEGDPRFQAAFARWQDGFIVKPVRGRASLHVEHVPDAAALPQTVEAVQAATQGNVLIEGYLAGREYCVGCCGPVLSRQGRLERHPDAFAFACTERVLQPQEKIFTSMDVTPITAERLRPLVSPADAATAERLRRLARTVFTDLGLETLVRLDVRADAAGRLYVLEANPKPDLKAPDGNGVTGIICAGLAQEGMTYDDLIQSLLADRLDLLFSTRRDTLGTLLKFAA